MALNRRLQFVYITVGVMLGIIYVLALLDASSLELFFIISFVSFLVLIEFRTPMLIAPRWQRRLRWVIVFGLLLFGYIVIRRSLRAISEGMI